MRGLGRSSHASHFRQYLPPSQHNSWWNALSVWGPRLRPRRVLQSIVTWYWQVHLIGWFWYVLMLHNSSSSYPLSHTLDGHKMHTIMSWKRDQILHLLYFAHCALWFDCTAYAAGTEYDSDEDAAFNTCAMASGQTSAGTDTGRDKHQSPDRDSVDTHAADEMVVCPSGEALETTMSTSSASHCTHKCSAIFRSCSMPQMCSHPPPVTRVDSGSLDAELRYLSMYAKLRQFANSPLENSKKGRIAKSPYMSPLLASDEMLQQLCPVHLIVCSVWFFSYCSR